MKPFRDSLNTRINKQKELGLYRQRKVLDSPQSVQVKLGGKKFVNFSSNDYLGLANHPKLKEAFKKGVDLYGCGSGASHLMSGHTKAHHQFEEEIAGYLNVDSALLYSSGYMANLGVMNALLSKEDSIYQDKLNHASLIDAGLSANATFKRFPHLNYEKLESLLNSSEYRFKLLVSDAIFSMDGDAADLSEILRLTEKYQGVSMIDDAHGFGVLGEQGKGLPEQQNISYQSIDYYMATCGKAMGVAGAFIAGSTDMIDALIQFSRTYTYTTAMPAAQAFTLSESLRLIQNEGWRRKHLLDLIAYFKQCAQQIDLQLMPSDTAIQPIIIGESNQAIRLAASLYEKGILVTAVRPPTVPKNSARIRMTLSANHTNDDIDHLISCLADSLNSSQI